MFLQLYLPVGGVLDSSDPNLIQVILIITLHFENEASTINIYSRNTAVSVCVGLDKADPQHDMFLMSMLSARSFTMLI